MTEVRIRDARPDEHATVMGILDAAMLEADAAAVRATIEAKPGGNDPRDTVLVAVEGDRVLGTLVLEGREITAVAVRPNRRGAGIGSALVEAADERIEGALLARFDGSVRPFYDRLDLEVESVDGEECRYRGVWRDCS